MIARFDEIPTSYISRMQTARRQRNFGKVWLLTPILDALVVSVLADRAQVETGDAERLGADL